ncbi:MAG: hypothetical protein V2B19_26500 [Pseudomonadota bacterium]
MADKKKETSGLEKVRLGRLGDRPYWIYIFAIFIRAIHQIGAAVFLTSFLVNDMMPLPRLYLVIASVSGVLLLGAEALKHRQLLRELLGVSTLVKLVILGLVYHGWVPGALPVLFAFVLSSICSHAPKSFRHRLLF